MFAEARYLLMKTANLLSPNDSLSPVTSFEAGVMTVSGVPVGICLKFRHFDKTDSISHWPLAQFGLLMKALLQYVEEGRHEQFMFRAKADPSLVAALPPRHPYHTLLSEKPSISEEEISGSSPKSRVQTTAVVDRGVTLIARVGFADGGAQEICMHEYTAFSLWGYLDEYVNAFAKLSGPTVGGTH